MKTLKLIQLGALLTLLATTAVADDQKMPFQVPPTGTDPGVLTTARGLWLKSGQSADERMVLMGHVSDAQGNKAITVHATLVPDEGDLGTALAGGKLHGELRLADAAVLSHALGSIFGAGSEDQAVGLRGRYSMNIDGTAGTFEAVIFVVRAPLSAAVPVGILRGGFSKGAPVANLDSLSSAKDVLSGANPFGLAAKGQPVTIECPADIYSRLFQVGQPFKAANPFSTPERTVEMGSFVAKWLTFE